jgi:hypothetical protein
MASEAISALKGFPQGQAGLLKEAAHFVVARKN